MKFRIIAATLATLLHTGSCLAAENQLIQAYFNNDYEEFFPLYLQTIDKNQTTFEDGTPFPFLHYSFYVEDSRFFDLVIQHTDPNHTDVSGFTAIFEVVRECDLKRAKALIERGAQINYHAKRNITVLHWTAESQCYDLADYLIQAGGDIYAPNEDGTTPLEIVKSKKDKKMMAIYTKQQFRKK